MLMVIFKVTDDNEVIGIDTKTFELYRLQLNIIAADIIRKQMIIDIMPRIYYEFKPDMIQGKILISDIL